MPEPVAKLVQAAAVEHVPDRVVLVQVGNVADFGDRQPPPPGSRGGASDLQGAEQAGEIPQPRIAQPLIVEHQHGMGIDRPPQGFDGGGADLPTQVNTRDPGREMVLEGGDGKGHDRFLRSFSPILRYAGIMPYWRAARQGGVTAAITGCLHGR